MHALFLPAQTHCSDLADSYVVNEQLVRELRFLAQQLQAEAAPIAVKTFCIQYETEILGLQQLLTVR